MKMFLKFSPQNFSGNFLYKFKQKLATLWVCKMDDITVKLITQPFFPISWIQCENSPIFPPLNRIAKIYDSKKMAKKEKKKFYIGPTTLCSRNFQNVKLRIDFVEIRSFYRYSYILCEIKFWWFWTVQKCHFWQFWTLNFCKFGNWKLLKFTKIKIMNL